jgi:hypothetical protein
VAQSSATNPIDGGLLPVTGSILSMKPGVTADTHQCQVAHRRLEVRSAIALDLPDAKSAYILRRAPGINPWEAVQLFLQYTGANS